MDMDNNAQQCKNLLERVSWAQQAYRRVLGGWAQDVLLLRARGLSRPGWPAGPVVEQALTPPSAQARVRHVSTSGRGRSAA